MLLLEDLFESNIEDQIQGKDEDFNLLLNPVRLAIVCHLVVDDVVLDPGHLTRVIDPCHSDPGEMDVVSIGPILAFNHEAVVVPEEVLESADEQSHPSLLQEVFHRLRLSIQLLLLKQRVHRDLVLEIRVLRVTAQGTVARLAHHFETSEIFKGVQLILVRDP